MLTEAAINSKRRLVCAALKENVIMGRLIPAGTGMAFYRRVKIAGEDVIPEEAIQEPDILESNPTFDEDARTLYTGGLSEDTGPSEELTEAE